MTDSHIWKWWANENINFFIIQRYTGWSDLVYDSGQEASLELNQMAKVYWCSEILIFDCHNQNRWFPWLVFHVATTSLKIFEIFGLIFKTSLSLGKDVVKMPHLQILISFFLSFCLFLLSFFHSPFLVEEFCDFCSNFLYVMVSGKIFLSFFTTKVKRHSNIF